MNDLLFPILVAVTVVLFVWGIGQILGGLTDEKKKLAQRLSGEGKSSGGFDPSTLTVVRRQTVISGVSGVLARVPLMESLALKITRTWPSFSLAKFAFVSIGLAVVAFVAATLVSDAAVMGVGAGAVAGILPLLILNNRQGAQEKALMNQLPEALDFLSRVLRAGHSLSTGLQMMAEELPPPLCIEFRRCYDQHSLGQPLEEALKDAAVRVDNADFGFFVTSILIQRQTGGDLSEVLTNISGMIRGRIRLQQHVKAKTAEGRFTGYILVVFPIIMFFICYIESPEYAKVLLHTTKGMYLLGIAGFMLILGLFTIRKITTVKV
jgi:tight adherence protein B